MENLEEYYGRLFTESQLNPSLKKIAQSMPAMTESKGRYCCNRCGSQVSTDNRLPTGDYYCRECIILGRICSTDKLYYFSQQSFFPQKVLKWSGQLTPYQAEVSDGLLEGLKSKRNLLVHAVTGAGKTEMIYQVVAKVIENGGSVCLASPRIDVCLELFKRLSKDFSCPITLLHGESDSYQRAPLIVSTTHQLLKFYEAFDLLIIDEVDAFPFVDNAVLYHAVEQSIKPDGVKVFLTATSTDELEKKVKRGELTKLHLARRFHANPLVIPQTVWLSQLSEKMKKQKLPHKLIHLIQKQRQTRFPLLLFSPNIKNGQIFTRLLADYFPDEKVAFVSSQTENRLEIVEQFRLQKITMLVSTTILERGVTFPCVDVFVLQANHRLYTRSALVQISGRVGRSAERPTGELLFLHDGLSKAMQKAIREIRKMNKKGGF